ncbi:MAG: PEP-CTERM sorting domain-containing protein [Planctomycetota bacterium]
MSHPTTAQAAACAFAFACVPQAFAQGTATSPSTSHVALPPMTAYAGGPNDFVNGPSAFPIDLDPSGGPWRKTISSDPVSSFIGPGTFLLVETIVNTGAEAWGGWEEQVFSAGLGVGWDTTVSVTVNGSPITFTESISGGALLLDNFSPPVFPGDVLEIQKNLFTTANIVGPNQPLFGVVEYPIAVPEPATAALLGGALLLARRRR